MDSEIIVIEFDYNGNEVEKNSKVSVAKNTKFLVTNTEKYFIKVCTAGLNSSKFFDPLKDLTEELKRHDVFAGRDRYSYKLVNKECFDYYLNYLKTKNVSLLRNAERIM
jgi:hypothetical protein